MNTVQLGYNEDSIKHAKQIATYKKLMEKK